MCVCVGGRRREWEGEGWGWTHKLGLGLQREWEEETKVFTATQDRQTEASFTTTRKPSGFEAAIRSEVELSFQALTPSCAARTSRWFFSGEVGKKKKKMLWRLTLAVAVVCVGGICNCVQADLMSRLIIPRDYGVKLCGREFIRAVIFTCGGSRWRRSTEGDSGESLSFN